eukprot:2123239-Amphidinium_carterae.1
MEPLAWLEKHFCLYDHFLSLLACFSEVREYHALKKHYPIVELALNRNRGSDNTRPLPPTLGSSLADQTLRETESLLIKKQNEQIKITDDQNQFVTLKPFYLFISRLTDGRGCYSLRIRCGCGQGTERSHAEASAGCQANSAFAAHRSESSSQCATTEVPEVIATNMQFNHWDGYNPPFS